MQKVTTTIKESKENNIQWESFELGNREMLFDTDKQEEYKKIIDDLGLQGQKDLIADAGGRIIPFPKLSQEELMVWEQIAPRKIELSKFKETIIPYEIAQIISLCKANKYFEFPEITKEHTDAMEEGETVQKGFIQVWYEAPQEIDPLLVGILSTQRKCSWGLSSGDNTYYLLARWGHSLKDFFTLSKIAKDRWISREKVEAESQLREAKRKLEDIDMTALQRFGF